MSLRIELRTMERATSYSPQMPVYRLGSLYFVQDLASASTASTAFPAPPDVPTVQIGVRIICGVNLWLVSGTIITPGTLEGFTAAGVRTTTLANIARGQFNAGDVIDMAAAPGQGVAWIAR